MSIGFYLSGELTSAELQPSELLHRLQSWILRESFELHPQARHGFIDEKPTLFCSFHPAAEEVEISLTDPTHITVLANTSSCGPGYHIYLCDLIHRLRNDFSVRWIRFRPDDDTSFGDETEYFFSGDKGAVYQHMKSWLKTLAGSFFDGTLDGNANDIALCMPMNVRFQGHSSAITQLGPRDRDWLRGISEGFLDYREFFPWYDEGFGAGYHLGRALVQMWCDVRWRAPVNEDETNLLKSVLDSLEMAHRLDPTLSFPWNEWKELLEIVNVETPGMNFVKEKAFGPGQIGYRRGRVRTSLPGYWSMETDGSFSEFHPDTEGGLSAFDPPREVWFTAYSFSADQPEKTFHRMRDEALRKRHEYVHEKGTYISVADITSRETEGERYYVLQSSNIGILCRSVCTLVFQDTADRDWAVRVWKSLTPPAQV